jgi:hypothetical protein
MLELVLEIGLQLGLEMGLGLEVGLELGLELGLEPSMCYFLAFDSRRCFEQKSILLKITSGCIHITSYDYLKINFSIWVPH